MIEEADADELAGLGHASGEGQILRARRWVARGMGVEEDETVGAAQESPLDDRPRLDRRAAQGAAEDVALADQAVADVEIKGAHDLLVFLGVAEGEVRGDGFRSVQEVTPGHPDAGQATRELDRRQQRSAPGRANAGEIEILVRGSQETDEPAEVADEPVGELDRLELGSAAQQQGDELGIAERGAAGTACVGGVDLRVEAWAAWVPSVAEA